MPVLIRDAVHVGGGDGGGDDDGDDAEITVQDISARSGAMYAAWIDGGITRLYESSGAVAANNSSKFRWKPPRKSSRGSFAADDYLEPRLLPLFLGAPVEVILLVCISSPMYLEHRQSCALLVRWSSSCAATHDCRKRFPPSSFSCSDRTDSTRSTMSRRLACSALACLGERAARQSSARM